MEDNNETKPTSNKSTNWAMIIFVVIASLFIGGLIGYVIKEDEVTTNVTESAEQNQVERDQNQQERQEELESSTPESTQPEAPTEEPTEPPTAE